MKKLIPFISYCLLVFAISCSSSDDSENSIDYVLPNITTLEPQKVSTNQARINVLVEKALLDIGDIADGRQTDYTQLGFIWSTEENLDSSDNIEHLNPLFGTFHFTLTNLTPETVYYYKPFAINANDEITYGNTKSFTTQGSATCSHSSENYFEPVYTSYQPLQISKVELSEPTGFNDGNIEFTAVASNSRVRIIIHLNEIGKDLPLSGVYKGVHRFDNQSIKSYNEVQITLQDYNGIQSLPQGGVNDTSAEIYIENTSNKLTFIFCDTKIGDYNLNGKFSYTIR